MSHTDLPQELRYAKTHEWLNLAPDGTATVGITGMRKMPSATSPSCSSPKSAPC